MLWLIGQIIIFLLIAAIIGFLVGWLLRALWPSGRNRAREGELKAALERAGARITDLEAGIRSNRVAANAAAEQEEAARRRVEELEASLANLHSQADPDTGEVDRLQEELDTAVGSISHLRHEVDDLRVDAGELAELRAERDAALRELQEREAELAELTGRPETDPAQPDLFTSADPEPASEPDPDGEPEPEPEPELDEAALEEERLSAVAAVTDRFRPEGPVDPDDLKQIKGIGPVLERTLNDMNVFTFEQIAAFDADDVAMVSAALGRAFPDRITRDDWIGGARELLGE